MKYVSILTLLFLVWGCDTSSRKQPDKKPNIVFVFADDQRYGTIRALGNEEIHTPHLDRLAQRGVSFTNAYIMGSYSGAVCMPSRAMLFSGRYLNHLTRDGRVIPEQDTVLGQALKRGGYHGFFTGKYHNDAASLVRGFDGGDAIFFGGMHDHWNVPLNTLAGARSDSLHQLPVIKNFHSSNEVSFRRGEYINEGTHSTDIFFDDAISFIEHYDKPQPFFLFISLMTPHDPRSTHNRYHRQYDTLHISLPPNFMPEHPFDNGELKIRDELLAPFPRTPEVVQQHLRDYYALITHNDQRLGDVMKVLEQKNIADQTILIYSADNGLAVGQHGLMGKQNLYEHSIKVPLVISGPGIPSNQQLDAMVYLTDIFPTLCDLVEVPVPSTVDGTSFYGVIVGEREAHRDQIVTTYKNVQRAIRSSDWKMIEYRVDGQQQLQLFDLQDDPFEMENVAERPENQGVLVNMQEALTEQLIQLDDQHWN